MKERYWTTLVYLDSVKDNWKELLQETGLQCVISPYHDKDINEDGTIKKAHYHILIMFDGPTTHKNVMNISKERLSGVEVKPVKSVKGIIRYFTHKDNPDKAQYNEEEMQTINGFDYKEIMLTKTEVEFMKRQCVRLIRELEIREYKELYDYLVDNSMYDFAKIISDNTIFFTAYLRSNRYLTNNKI